MSDENEMKEILSEISDEQKARVNSLSDELWKWIEQKGPDGYLAFALVGFSMQQQIKSNASGEGRP